MLIAFIIYCSSPPARITPPEGHRFVCLGDRVTPISGTGSDTQKVLGDFAM